MISRWPRGKVWWTTFLVKTHSCAACWRGRDMEHVGHKEKWLSGGWSILRTVEPTEGLRSQVTCVHTQEMINSTAGTGGRTGWRWSRQGGGKLWECLHPERRKDGTQIGIVAMGWERPRDFLWDCSWDILKEGWHRDEDYTSKCVFLEVRKIES